MTISPLPRPITRVLVANRGEIARRVFATCRARGIETIAVFSDADENAEFVVEADAAVRLPGTAPADTYLRGDLIVEAAARAGADAIHPGYGFLSENAAFARQVIAAGLTWIGPDPENIDQMGSKVESKRLMEAAGVPVLSELNPRAITADQLPILVKASEGGGGRGMRVVERLEDLDETIHTAGLEAASAFGDPTVFCERYIPDGHHIEVQVFGDRHGTVWALGERECSIQRRHQKVVEEAPAPLVERHGAAMRDRLYAAARAAASQINYIGAGTVEFLANDRGDFFFLEMNTRLQVEHPVTECTTGLDLVGLQLDIAAGAALIGEPPRAAGHAIEVRLYAEDPQENWAPQSGAVHTFDVPGAHSAFTIPRDDTAVRLDAGVGAGSTISTFYDPMIAKIIGVGPDRATAARTLAAAIEGMSWDGPVTNAALLTHVLREPGFLAGNTTTAYFDEHPEVFAPAVAAFELRIAAVAAAVATATAAENGCPAGPDGMIVTNAITSAEDALAVSIASGNPRPNVGGWRLFHPDYRSRSFAAGQVELPVKYRHTRAGWEFSPETLADGPAVTVVQATPTLVRLEIDGVERRFSVTRRGTSLIVASARGTVALKELPRYTDPSALTAPGSLLAPMPGTVVRVEASVGEAVEAGQGIIWLEAMKMMHTISSDAAGVVEALRVSVGDQVDVGMLLAVIAEASDEATGSGTGKAVAE
ncbi:propionyl-CoA carboxylase alpha chain [Leucobacter komagatae]|uniref:Propionyl-CoA carboxylase alpha chain n=1 Tax=Leucobacter komagatae TaxID=55969 RepID=A0A542XY44_9MICO|nr:biotin carboxylase N-terminal domain-containing protein [Leucobacter komagatae]TQL40744.1 propionyl-CoA carboxylase alpha chain [Leucobacter komagatae]